VVERDPRPDTPDADEERQRLRASVTQLLSTQQELIATRERLDRELVAMQGALEFNARALGILDLDALSALLCEVTAERFDWEIAAVLHSRTGRIEASCGCAPIEPDEAAHLAAHLIAVSDGDFVLLEGPRLAGLTLGGQPLDRLLAGWLDAGPEGARVAAIAAVTLHNAEHYPPETASLRPAFELFLRHAGAIRRDLVSRQLIAAQVEELRRANDTLEATVAERTRELALQNLELAQSTRLKSEFLGTMSHELRNPLNAILGLAESLRAGVYGTFDAEVDVPLAQIESSGRHLLASIDDILDMSNLDAGRLDLRLDVTDPAALARTAMGTVRAAASERGLTVRLGVEDPLPAIRVDTARVRQALLRVLHNAVKFTPRGGFVGLSVRVDGPWLAFEVLDSGIGIANEDLHRLFEPFGQLDAGITRRFPGTGLGLALARRLISLHRGTIDVQSAAGRGTAVTLRLPLEPSR